MGWYCYLDDNIAFPFKAICTDDRAKTPLRFNEEVDVTRMAGEDECRRDMLVTVSAGKKTKAVPLSQLQPVPGTDRTTRQAVGDWHYWVAMGYSF